jgi:CRISPR-associated protein (TIGR03986 family)
MKKSIPSPYSFLPINHDVHTPDWQNINQDEPIKDGLSGTLTFTLHTKSPLILGDRQKEGVLQFFQVDEKPAIPGTSIKGMVRSVIEVATNSKITAINDEKLSFRDLTQQTYRNLLTASQGKTYRARSKAGWLKFKAGNWELYSADLHRVENRDIETSFGIKKINDRNPEDIYKKLNGIQPVKFTSNPEEEHLHSEGNLLIYAKVTDFQKNHAKSDGYLIVTGQVSDKKHMNFIFSKPENRVQLTSEKVVQDFLAIVNKKDPQKKQNIFEYLKSLNHPHGIPVFYITNNKGEASVMGLAQMFRFPYDNSIKEMLPKSHQLPQKDFATLLFGETDDEARKGRVSFGLSKLNEQSPRFLPQKTVILGSPKPSFYPAYLNQKEKVNKTERVFNTYNNQHLGLAGRKQYLVHQSVKQKTVPQEQQNVASKFIPLDKEHSFTGKLRFHNISKVELGALIWALTLGEEQMVDSAYFHLMGYAKPLGYGKVQFTINNLDIANNEPLTLLDCLNEFYYYQEQVIQASINLKQIRALHKEGAIKDDLLIYPDFDKKEFNTIKKEGHKLIDIPYTSENEWYQQASKSVAAKIQEEQSKRFQEALAQREREKEIQELEKQKQKELQDLERLQNRSAEEVIFQDVLKNVIDKSSLALLSDQTNLWTELDEKGQRYLAGKIMLSDWFKQNKRKKLKDKFPSLLPLVDLVL